MEAYTVFAEVYDQFMDNIPYEEWSDYLAGLLEEYGVRHGLIAELGCGTGSLTVELSQKGYDMIGIDNSEEMLSIARVKSDDRILYLLQDMREFELYGTVRAVISICDSMNYILMEEDLLKVFSLVNKYLDAGGIFIFDLNTEYKYRTVLADSVIAENREAASFIWENCYYEDEKINEYIMTFFLREENGLYRKYEEVHDQKAYTVDQVTGLLRKAGMEFIAAYDAFTRNAPGPKSERIYIVAREGRQKGKLYL